MPKKSHVDDLDDPKYGPPAPEPSDSPEVPAVAESADEKPKPKPGDPDYDWAPHYPGCNDLYTHTFPDGKVIAMRSFGAIYSKTWLYKLRNAETDTDIQFAAFDRATCATARAILESVEAPLDGADPLDELWTAWSEAGTAHVDGAKGLSTGE